MPKHLLTPIDREQPLSIVVVGASGDLALKKIFPALFALFCQELLPKQCRVIGFARSPWSVEKFRGRVTRHLTCRYSPGEKCEEDMQAFLERLDYIAGQYDSADDFRRLGSSMQATGAGTPENRVFYMSIPPFLFLPVARSMEAAGLVKRNGAEAWSRVVIEKPFGRDRASSDQLTRDIGEVFTEEQTYRIDHYLGKEVIQNLLVLRFANLIFDPVWNRACIDYVRISWMEDIGIEGRAGYFDEYGIIRDVMQNHLLQIVALVAMEEPISLDAKYVRDEKVKVLRSIPAVTLDDIVVGQYTDGEYQGQPYAGYLEEEGIPGDSITPTYAATAVHVKNRRWDGVPFLIRAGKALDARMTEILIRFREVPSNIFAGTAAHLSPNELVVRVQPDAGIAISIINKVPGLTMQHQESSLDLRYESAFKTVIPDAYECLLLDVILGDKSLFIRADELEAAWDIFTPVLSDLETCTIKPQGYAFGSSGPRSGQALAALYGAEW